MLEEFDYAGRVIVYASITNGRCKILYYFNSTHKAITGENKPFDGCNNEI